MYNLSARDVKFIEKLGATVEIDKESLANDDTRFIVSIPNKKIKDKIAEYGAFFSTTMYNLNAKEVKELESLGAVLKIDKKNSTDEDTHWNIEFPSEDIKKKIAKWVIDTEGKNGVPDEDTKGLYPELFEAKNKPKQIIKNVKARMIIDWLHADFNALQLLFEEGYLDDNGKLKDDVSFEDVNYILEQNGEEGLIFDNDQDFNIWVINVLNSAKMLFSKLKI